MGKRDQLISQEDRHKWDNMVSPEQTEKIDSMPNIYIGTATPDETVYDLWVDTN